MWNSYDIMIYYYKGLHPGSENNTCQNNGAEMPKTRYFFLVSLVQIINSCLSKENDLHAFQAKIKLNDNPVRSFLVKIQESAFAWQLHSIKYSYVNQKLIIIKNILPELDCLGYYTTRILIFPG